MTENERFDEIYKKYKNLVYKAAYIYSGNYDAAEDITQYTFLQLYIYFDDVVEGNIKSWLYTTAKHYALNCKKKASREILEEDMSREGIITENCSSAEEEVLLEEKHKESAELQEQIFAALFLRNPRWYQAISLVYQMGIPQARVAEGMGIQVDVLYSILYRAKCWIKNNYGVEYDELGRF